MLVLFAVMFVLILCVVAELVIIALNGSPVPAPTIARTPQTLGKGPALTYVVMGDSTAIGQGTDYKNSYAFASAQHLSKTHRVTFVNVGVSGAVTADIPKSQLDQAIKHHPDLVLLAVGANDATHFTSRAALQTALQQSIDGVKKANPQVHIVVTGSPAMDAVPRFPWPARGIMGVRTGQVNNAFAPIIKRNNLTFAPVADKTRVAFQANPTLFAADKFHPNTRGYALWTPVINEALDEALAKPSL